MRMLAKERYEAMDIARGFRLERPRIFVPWGIAPRELVSVFNGLDLQRIGDGYYLADCQSLGGLSHSLGFSFDRTRRRLSKITFGMPNVSIDESYKRFQQHLVATFGPPTRTSPGEEMEECPHHTWLIPGVRIEHYVIEHFGPSEWVYISTEQDSLASS